MKKILLSTLLVGLMSTSLMAADGTVDFIKAKGDGSVTVAILDSSDGIVKAKQLVGSADAIQAMLAISLTAKSIVGSTITGNVNTIGDVTGWGTIVIK